MARIGLPPRRTMSTEYVSDLQPGPGHPGARSLQTSRQCLTLQFGQRFIGADRVSDRFGGDMGVLCSGRQFGVAEQHLDDPHVRVGFQQMRCGFRKFPDTYFSNSRTRVSVNPGQGFR